MKNYLKNIVFFLAPLLILGIVLEIFVSLKLKKSHDFNGEIEVWEDIYNSRIKSDIAIYGSSRACVHIDPEILEDSLNMPAYNFGLDGHNFWLQYYRHQEYLKHNSQPKLIIYSVDAFTLQKRENLYNQNQFLPYMLWNNKLYKYTNSYQGYSTVDYMVPFVRYLKQNSVLNIKKLLKNGKRKNYRTKGFSPQKRSWNSDLKNAKENTEKYVAIFDKKSMEMFDNFIEECKKKNIELILVYTPEYIEGQEYISNRKEIIDYYKKLAEKYNLQFWDYSDNELNFNKEYFYNSLHLNATGAKLFTEQLSTRLKHYRYRN